MHSFIQEISPTTSIENSVLRIDSAITISNTEPTITIDISFPSTSSLFYITNQSQIIISNDIRLLFEDGMELASAGITSMLILGAPLPPSTPFKNIKSFIPGNSYIIDKRTLNIKEEVSCQWSSTNKEDFTLSIEKCCKRS
jgi:hypothetical protein